MACRAGRPPRWRRGRGDWRKRTGIEPARPSYSVSPVLKTGRTTRILDASERLHIEHSSRRAFLFEGIDALWRRPGSTSVIKALPKCVDIEFCNIWEAL